MDFGVNLERDAFMDIERLEKHEVLPAIAVRHDHPATPTVTLTADLFPTVDPMNGGAG